MMLHIAKIYQQETDHFLSQLVTFLEPAIIIFLGIVIGGILISMYLPLFELSNVIQ
jgi:type IV pilus assembly protein PilC